VSNDLFYFEHVPMRTDGIVVTQPDGSIGKIENAATGKYRSTFDVHLTQPGTYRIGSVSTNMMGSYRLNGKQERLPRGTTKDKLASVIPAGATDVQVAEVEDPQALQIFGQVREVEGDEWDRRCLRRPQRACRGGGSRYQRQRGEPGAQEAAPPG